eukprot:2234874-Prymnesium_polylepis.1
MEMVRGLGSGGFAQVYMVRDKGTLREYALKIVSKARLLKSRPIQARARALALLRLPGTARA